MIITYDDVDNKKIMIYDVIMIYVDDILMIMYADDDDDDMTSR